MPLAESIKTTGCSGLGLGEAAGYVEDVH